VLSLSDETIAHLKAVAGGRDGRRLADPSSASPRCSRTIIAGRKQTHERLAAANHRVPDNPHAPDVFADTASGLFIFNGNLRLTLESVRVNHVSTPGPVSRVVIGRLVMPLAGAEAMARGILEFIEKQRAGTLAPSEANRTLQ